MKQSLRARRMARHHRRHKNTPGLNLVSLMDIFTILVFFLLVNSSHVQVLQADSSLDLPTSNADQLPDEQLVVMVTTEDILVAGRRVARVAEIDREANTIAGLAQELGFRRERERPLDEAGQARGYPVTIMGDQEIPYRLLKKIMTTCAEADYRDISLAVAQAADGGEP
ncbi:ExbD/TolR family protein [Marinimicrobium alkaliphilum]|uniref:ExbD/TolR family protein n=1 Tax=Marinimicrobium alkaliphilum TaxID=2202654 RepID=UPI0018E08E5F|nr:biopolymer transporter ExbD [Marinimicrobium alkaliphilum]